MNYLRKNNKQLAAQLRASQLEEARMREDNSCEDKIRDLKKEITALKDRRGSRSASSEMENTRRTRSGGVILRTKK